MYKKLSILLIITILFSCLNFNLLYANSKDVINQSPLTLKGQQFDELPFVTSQLGQGLSSEITISNLNISNGEITLDSEITDA